MNQVAGMPRSLSSARMRAAPITPNSPRDTGVGVVMPRAIQPEIASKSKLMQTMCFATFTRPGFRASIDARATFLRHLRPPRDVGLHELAELLGRVADRLEAEARNAFPDLRRPQRAGDFAVQFRDHGLGRPRGREQPVPPEHLESREPRFGDGGKLVREGRALRSRYREPADTACAYLGQARRPDGEHHLQLPGDEIGDR